MQPTIASIKAKNIEWISTYRCPILAALGLRLAASLWLAFVWIFLDPYFPLTEKAIAETYNHLTMHTSWIGRAFIDVWLRWDAVHYMNLAWGGYQNASEGDMNFWPLYPYLVRIFSPIFRNEIVFTGLLVSTITTVIACIFFWKIVNAEFQDKRLADWSVIMWMVYPTSIFLVAPFTDSLFACLAVISLWLIQQKKWIQAGIVCGFAGLARSQGIVLLVPLSIAMIIEIWGDFHRINWRMVVGFSLAPLGFILFLVIRNIIGLPNIFSSFSIYSKCVIVNPITGFAMSISRFFQSPDILTGTEIFSVILFAGIQIWMSTKKLFRRWLPFLAYGLVTILFILCKISITATPLQSSNRYVLNTLPAFVGFSFFVLRLSEKRKKFTLTLLICMSMVVGVLYAMWVFIG